MVAAVGYIKARFQLPVRSNMMPVNEIPNIPGSDAHVFVHPNISEEYLVDISWCEQYRPAYEKLDIARAAVMQMVDAVSLTPVTVESNKRKVPAPPKLSDCAAFRTLLRG